MWFIMTVRLATAADWSAIHTLYTTSLGYDFPVEKAQAALRRVLSAPGHTLLVITDNQNQIQGYVHVENYLTTYCDPMYNVLALAVAPSSQGRGYGRQLMTAIEKFAGQHKIRAIRLNSGSKRLAAHAFYEHLGYQSSKMQKRFIKWL